MLCVIAAVALLYLLTLREGRQGGDDYAQYILHARNLATRAPYAETGYILNPHYPELGPQSYPPGYPLLLAPIYRWRGLDLRAMQYQSVLLLVAFLPFCFLLMRRELPFWSALVGLLAIGLCPVLWEFKESISSDFAFLFFLFACFVLIDCHHHGEARRLPWPLFGLIVSAVVWFCAAVRAVGLAVIPALLLLDVLRRRRISRFAVFVTAAAGSFFLLQGALAPGTEDYVARLWPIDPSVVWYNAIKYTRAAGTVWSNGYFAPLGIGLHAVALLAGFWAFAKRLRKRATVLETFIPFYAVALLVFPGSAARYLFPVIPLYLFYVLLAFRDLTSSLGPRARALALVALACVVLAVYGAQYSTLDHGPLEDSADRALAEDLFRHIRATTREADVFVARRPRALSLYTGRRASVYHQSQDQALWSYFEDIGADYLVTGPEDTDHYRAFVDRWRSRLDVVYENPRFRLLAVGHAGDPRGTPGGATGAAR